MTKRFWTWPITLDLWLGGIGGGTMFLAMVLTFLYGETATGEMIVGSSFAFPALIAAVALAVAAALLVFELGNPLVFYRAFVTATAVIKWGALCITICLITAFIYFLTYVPGNPIFGVLALDFLSAIEFLRMPCLIIAGVSGFCIMIYTGVLLASMKPHAFWNTPALPITFLISGISLGAAVCMLGMLVYPLPESMAMLQYRELLFAALMFLNIAFVAAAGLIWVINVLMLRGTGNQTARVIAQKWIGGKFAALFWIVVVFLGTIVPIALYASGTYEGAVVASWLLLICGLVQRFMIVYSDGRRLIPGEKKFYDRLPGHHAAFLTAWKQRDSIFKNYENKDHMY